MAKRRLTKKCPRCGDLFAGPGALSREDSKTEICPHCGTIEAVNHAIKNGAFRVKDEEMEELIEKWMFEGGPEKVQQMRGEYENLSRLYANRAQFLEKYLKQLPCPFCSKPRIECKNINHVLKEYQPL